MSTKIDSKIVGYKIKKETVASDKPLVADTPTHDVMHEEIKRPGELKGYTYKIKTPLSDHALYITVNNILLNEGTAHEQEYPFEIFINSKNMEHFQWVVALTLIISAVFRKGGDITFMVEELKQVFDPQGGYFKKGGRFMPSLVAEIGDVLETHMKKCGLIKTEALSDEHKQLVSEKRTAFESNAANSPEADTTSSYPASAQLCKKCHTVAMVMMDGCMTCLACGDSKCG
ncbi:MAG: NrdJb [Pseudomonadales bacterium]|nr:NrdJb [Pseudomonadales bacterium]